MPSVFNQRYRQLNKQQRQAVDHVHGPLLVIAGPGSGKTELLSMRAANILRKTDVQPDQILCLTFTDAAADNMRRRLAPLAGRRAHRVNIATFHSFCNDVINQHRESFYNAATFLPADEITRLEILQDIFKTLSYDNPLAGQHNDTYTYLEATAQAIEYLKKAGLGAKEFKAILRHNEKALTGAARLVDCAFSERISKRSFKPIRVLLNAMWKRQSAFPSQYFSPLLPRLACSLEQVLTEAEETNRTAPLTAWKNRRVQKVNGKWLLKDQKYLKHMYVLADIYEKYAKQMHKLGYFDFQDMILDVIQEVNSNETLRTELQEQYQYVLVDELQDTNDAQMQLLRLVTGEGGHRLAEVPRLRDEGGPNVMAVGDDDQAIFKFQGADISNMQKFRDNYESTTVITLTNNYRSTQDILDTARHIILQGEDRLENKWPEVKKQLIAANARMKKGDIAYSCFANKEQSYAWAAHQIKQKKGNTAVIARTHQELQEFALCLRQLDIPAHCERQQNVLDQPHIHQLIQTARFVVSLLRQDREAADELLPEILSYPFWAIDRLTIWNLAKLARDKRESWLDCMFKSDRAPLRSLADFFLNLASQAASEPLEYILDRFISDSPFKEHYFSQQKLAENPEEYVQFLSGLRAFISALRKYRPGQCLKLDDLITFADFRKTGKQPISDHTSIGESQSAVQLLTAHGAKGLEFDNVFVLNCQEAVWAGRQRGELLPFPGNLPIAPAGDTADDKLRLFFVALTRAKRCLYLLACRTGSAGRPLAPLHFLQTDNLTKLLREKEVSADMLPETICALKASCGFDCQPAWAKDEKKFLAPLIENYKMSATHLNNFLDIARGGPQMFLEKNLLRFPQAKTAASAYGSAMHKLIQLIHLYLKKHERRPSLRQILRWLTVELSKQRLSQKDFHEYLQRGRDALAVFYPAKKNNFRREDIVEMDFTNQAVVIHNVQLTGKIDRMVKAGRNLIVYDLKTGRAEEKWNSAFKLTAYRRQLLFYKLLVENSRQFKGRHKVEQGILEFIEPLEDGRLIELHLDIDDDETACLQQLIKIVYTKIRNLDFPSIDGYDKTEVGARRFESDLLEGRI